MSLFSWSGGWNHLFRRIIFSIHGHGKCFLKNYFHFMVWKISVNGYNLVSILHYFMENISVLTKCNVLFNNGHLILIWFFLLIDNEFDLKITLKILYPENHQVYWCKSTKCCYFQNRFQYKSKIICVIKIKTKRIRFLFKVVIYLPLSIQLNILTLYDNYYVILTAYKLDSALKLSEKFTGPSSSCAAQFSEVSILAKVAAIYL